MNKIKGGYVTMLIWLILVLAFILLCFLSLRNAITPKQMELDGAEQVCQYMLTCKSSIF